MDARIEAPATRRWRPRSRSLVLPLLITMVGVVVSFAIAIITGVDIVLGMPWLPIYVPVPVPSMVGLLITGILTALSSSDLRRAGMAMVAAVGILWIAPSILLQLASGGTYLSTLLILTLGALAVVSLLVMGLGLGAGAAIGAAARRRRQRVAGGTQ